MAMAGQQVKGKSVTIPEFRVLEDGKIGVVNLGEAIQEWINSELGPPDRIIALHISEIPDPSINVGGVQGRKAAVTVIYQ